MKLNPILLSIAALALAGTATATTRPDDVNSVVVKYGDLNLNSQAGIARLHKRISNAAESVCASLDSRILALRSAYQQCVAEAIEHGIAAVDNAKLRQFHATNGRHLVLASNRR